MRWNCPSKESKVGRKRTITKFLLFPRCINGEARWLERVAINQEYKCFHGGRYEPPIYSWDDIEWVEVSDE